MKFKNIKGGTEKDAYNKFPWLERATFENADIDITKNYLVWKDGIWEGGFWEGGIWKGGIWEGGSMWDNINQKYQRVVIKGRTFEIK